MEIKISGVWFSWLVILIGQAVAQIPLDYLGLRNREVSTIGVNYGILAAGTDRQGVYWQSEMMLPDTGWNFIGLDSAEVWTVYPHKSGPLGWAIAAGIRPDSAYPDYVYCSFLGGAFEPRDEGISDSVAMVVWELDGFPDPSICGETYAATRGALYRRNFGDSTWVPLYTCSSEGNVRTVKVNEESPGVVLAGGGEGVAGILLLKSLNYGVNWEWLTPPGFVTDIDFCGATADTIFVMAGHVYRSVDGGQTWFEIFNTSWIDITQVLYDPTGGILYIAGYHDLLIGDVIFYSRDLGDSWEMISLNLTGPVIDLERSQSGWIYLATGPCGVYRFDPALLPIGRPPSAQVMSDFRLHQNYPNPFNSETVIPFYIAIAAHVRMDIYTITGQRIRTLMDGLLPPGEGERRWDGTADSGREAASGIYFCRLRTGDQVLIKKMFLLR